MNRRSATRVGAAALIVLALVIALLITRSGGSPTPVAVPPPPVPTLAPATPSPAPPPTCSTVAHPFVPTSVSIPGVVGKVSVLALHRDANGVPGVPPISAIGKTEMAFDLGNGIEPGDPRGNALLNAHTWPDGTALGNRLLAELHDGAKIVVHGVLGQICYQVSDRVEVPFDDPGIRYFATAGPPQIAIIVCSGKRVGPGEWTKRTIWYASPMV